jgi:DNA gyrase inhibitor GyrI
MTTIWCVTQPIVIEEAEFEVARVEADGGPSGAAAAFGLLEERMQTLRGRKMYGVLYPGDPERYFACLRLDAEDPDALGFDRAIVPGGHYGRRLVRDWSAKVHELPDIFGALHSDLVASGYLIDPSRPLIEFYRRSDELTVMMPVLAVTGSR